MKTYTVYITSNVVGDNKVFHISHSAVRSIIALGSILLVLFIALAFDYIHLNLSKDEFAREKSDYQYLITNLQFIESQLNGLENQLQVVDNLTEKIEVIQENYNRGPIATMSTPTEYFSIDYVATGDSRTTNTLTSKNIVQGAWIENRNRLLSKPFLYDATEEEEPFSEKMVQRIEVASEDTQLLERKVMQLWENLSERQNFIRATPSVRPSRGWFSSRFGIRADPFTGRPTMHSGLDLASRYGAPVMATADGVVTFVGYQNGYGHLVAVDHGYGIETRYAHNSKLYVQRGQKVRRYDVIAAVGNSGRSTGPHVHYEVRVRGVAVDPINYILDF
ncbi:MAG: M23 family metallopeptidase [Bdellovibrionales bacterium]|nr:M23 family metallopeptidase [Bdellovibrionales bacterium]